jgi:hypothetical protein
MPETELAEALRKWAKGDRRLEATVGLLIAHRTWIVWATTVPFGAGVGPFPGAKLYFVRVDERDVAVIGWAYARALSLDESMTDCSISDRQILRIAVALAGTGAVPPGQLAGLGEVDLALVGEAVEHVRHDLDL